MRRLDLNGRDLIRQEYEVFKEYKIEVKSKKENREQHYVVPWEMNHEDCNKPAH